jgi:hypothetical protein
LIIAAVAKASNIAPAQVCFVQDASLVRCEMEISATAGLGHQQPVVVR